MRKLSRNGVDHPADWQTKVAAILPANYMTESARFEALAITSAVRDDGFKKFAPAAMPQTSGRDPTFKPLWSTVKAIKDSLDEMSEGRCAYCEQLINARRSGQVEHYKPKSLFPSLCYEMTNYFLACNGCNGSKSNKWPSTGSYIRPDVGDPAKKLTFTENGRVAASGVSLADTKVTIKDFALGRGGLVRARKVAIKHALGAIRDFLDFDDNIIPADVKKKLVRRHLRRIATTETPYETAIKQCIKAEWKQRFPVDPL